MWQIIMRPRSLRSYSRGGGDGDDDDDGATGNCCCIPIINASITSAEVAGRRRWGSGCRPDD